MLGGTVHLANEADRFLVEKYNRENVMKDATRCV